MKMVVLGRLGSLFITMKLEGIKINIQLCRMYFDCELKKDECWR